MAERQYLAYGSNLHPHRLKARTPSAQSPAVVELRGWRLAFHKRSHDGSGKCDLVCTGSTSDLSFGVVWRLKSEEKPILDKVEGVGFGYSEEQLELDGFGGVFTYTAQPEYVEPSLKPYDWYHCFVLEGARWHGFPKPYVDAIAAVSTIKDPDSARSTLNAQILSGKKKV